MDLDLIFKALANPTRRQILEWLKSPEQYLSAEECGGFQRGVCAGQIEQFGQGFRSPPCPIICLYYSRLA